MKNGNLVQITVESALIFLALAVLAWAGWLLWDYREVMVRDERRKVMLAEVQEGLEQYHRTNGLYPGTPHFEEGKTAVYADWHYLTTTAEMKNYYRFDDFFDPCQPQEPVNIKGLVICPSGEVKYIYQGIECQVGCQAYRLAVRLENGGEYVLGSD